MLELKFIGEILIIVVGIWLTVRNKSKTTQLKELEEKNRRLRIELVMKEEKLEELEHEIDYNEDVHLALMEKQNKALERSETSKDRIKSIRMEGVKRSKQGFRKTTRRKNKPSIESKE